MLRSSHECAECGRRSTRCPQTSSTAWSPRSLWKTSRASTRCSRWSRARLAPVRGETDTATLQFSDGTTNVLLHVTATEDGGRRVDGWVDASALAIRLTQGDRTWTAEAGEHGRFAFDSVTPGVSRLRLVVRGDDGEMNDFQTPQFEV